MKNYKVYFKTRIKYPQSLNNFGLFFQCKKEFMKNTNMSASYPNYYIVSGRRNPFLPIGRTRRSIPAACPVKPVNPPGLMSDVTLETSARRSTT